MINLVIYSGYANSRKTNTINPILRELGYTVFSTSDVLSDIVDNYFKAFYDTNFDSQDKNSSYIFELEKTYNESTYQVRKCELSRRELKIKFAEEVLIPIFGRELLARQVADRAKEVLDNNQLAAIETIGGDEFDCLIDNLRGYLFDVRFFNARHKDELPGVDIRELLDNSHDVDTDNYEACKRRLISLLDTF